MSIKKILLSFVGSNDSGKLKGKSEGAIFNTVSNMKFDEIYLIWLENTKPNEDMNKFLNIGNDLKKKLLTKNHCKKINIDFIDIKNPVDHNEIYPKLLEYCKNMESSTNTKYSAAISSGTPAMQVCWILMAESGDFKISLIRTNEPGFGGDIITPVKLGTGLPRILQLDKENKRLKKTFLPELKFYVKKRKIFIGESEIKLLPLEFCFYRYFAEKAQSNNCEEYIPRSNHLPLPMVKKLNEYYKESFPNSDKRETLDKAANDILFIPKSTLNENISNIKRKIKNVLGEDYPNDYDIKNIGSRNDSSYLIELDIKKIKIFER